MAEAKQGVVVSGYGSFYQVRLDSGGEEIHCKGRGRLKKTHDKILVGDSVAICLLADGSGVIEEIFPRRNTLLRPNIANVDQAVIVLAWQLPAYDLLLLDKLLLMCRLSAISTVICFNKRDLMQPQEEATFAAIRRAYTDLPVLLLSAAEDADLAPLLALLKDKCSVFAGPSGVGKSSLLNRLLPEEYAETGLVSDRLRRGKHTTKYVRLRSLPGGGCIADSPGFFVLDAPAALRAETLPQLYPAYAALAENCRFEGCRHDKEPGCAVKEAVAAGTLDAARYERYLRILAEVRTREVRY